MARTMTSETEKNIRGGACTPYDGRKALQAELDVEREVSRKLAERLAVMCREWREAIGTPEENSTPGDCLERAEQVLALYRESK